VIDRRVWWAVATAVAASFTVPVVLPARGATGEWLGVTPREPPRVRLDHGRIGQYRWAAYAHRASPAASPTRPCLTMESGGAPGSEASGGLTVCGSLSPVPSLVAHSEGEGKGERTVLGMAFPMGSASVRLWLAGRHSRRMDLKPLSLKQADSAGLKPFQYSVAAFVGPFCLRRFVSYGPSGSVLFSSSYMPCPRHRRSV
jgi:hypothetical protein